MSRTRIAVVGLFVVGLLAMNAPQFTGAAGAASKRTPSFKSAETSTTTTSTKSTTSPPTATPPAVTGTTTTETEPEPTRPPIAGLEVAAVDAWTARLAWAVPAGAAEVEILREGRSRDRFPATAGTSYTDGQLWPHTTYGYTVRFFDSAGAAAGQFNASMTTPVATTKVPRLYSDDSFWNTPIAAGSPIATNSTAMVQKALAAYGSKANFSNSDKWGIALTYANAASKNHPIGCTLWDCDKAVSGRIPSSALPSLGSDQHLAVIDRSNGTELDMYKTVHDTAAGTWTAGSRYTTSAAGWGAMCALGSRCNGANAAGFALMGGVIRPEEIAQGRIDHALVFTTPFTRAGVIACPATHTDGKFADPDAIPEGARIQLDPTFDVEAQAWPAWKKTVARALQQYGAYLGDTGGSLSIRGEASINRGYDAWASAGVTSSSLADLPWNSFRVLGWTEC